MIRGSVFGGTGGAVGGTAVLDTVDASVKEVADVEGGREEKTEGVVEEKRAEQGCIEQWCEVDRVARSRACGRAVGGSAVSAEYESERG
jgi:hypothetical protein